MPRIAPVIGARTNAGQVFHTVRNVHQPTTAPLRKDLGALSMHWAPHPRDVFVFVANVLSRKLPTKSWMSF
jgi:hypothetical protein